MTSWFRPVLFSIFGFSALVAILIFSGILPGFRPPAGGAGGTIVLWGTFPQGVIDSFLSDFNKENEASFNLKYIEKRSDSFDDTLTEALASGSGPDLAILTQESLLRQKNKILTIPFSSLPERDFLDNYIDGSQKFLSNEGVLAFPLAIDPLIMYYNKDLFINSGLALAPVNWSEFLLNVSALTKLDQAKNIVVSATPLGEFFNNRRAKDILALLLLQSGNKITSYDDRGSLESRLAEQTANQSGSPAQAAVDFFTQFSNPSKSSYTWNRSLPQARDSFLAGNLATYFGFATERATIKNQNPHLNFDVAIVPQREANRQTTYAKIYGVAVMKKSAKPAYAVLAGATLANDKNLPKLLAQFGLAPVRRSVLASGTSDPFLAVVYRSALSSLTWLDPDPAATLNIFQTMIEAINTGRATSNEALGQANAELTSLLGRLGL